MLLPNMHVWTLLCGFTRLCASACVHLDVRGCGAFCTEVRGEIGSGQQFECYFLDDHR